ncbi:MAG: hypothetical protein IRZ13_08735 [Acetobacteraceae bacterium]|nr:hypothetical protein [Acetobacteraceae bacterium]
MPIGIWLRIALAAVVGIVGLVALPHWHTQEPTGDYLAVALFAACAGYAMWQVRQYFDARERGGEN